MPYRNRSWTRWRRGTVNGERKAPAVPLEDQSPWLLEDRGALRLREKNVTTESPAFACPPTVGQLWRAGADTEKALFHLPGYQPA